MTRVEEFEKVKSLIKENSSDIGCGIFDCENWVGDATETVFDGDYFEVRFCYNWSYVEVLGTTEEEFFELKCFYDGCVR